MPETLQDLVSKFLELEGMEKQALRLYRSLHKFITDPKDIALVEGISKDEEHHAQLARECAEIVQKVASADTTV